MVGGLSDGRGGTDHADLADASGAHGVGVQIVLVEPDRIEFADTDVGGNVVADTRVSESDGQFWKAKILANRIMEEGRRSSFQVGKGAGRDNVRGLHV